MYHIHATGIMSENIGKRVSIYRKEECSTGQRMSLESVMYLKPDTRGNYKFNPRWEEGVWLGLRGESLVRIGTLEGVIKVRDPKRAGSTAEILDLAKFKALKGTPWEPTPCQGGVGPRARVALPAQGAAPPPCQKLKPRSSIDAV